MQPEPSVKKGTGTDCTETNHYSHSHQFIACREKAVSENQSLKPTQWYTKVLPVASVCDAFFISLFHAFLGKMKNHA